MPPSSVLKPAQKPIPSNTKALKASFCSEGPPCSFTSSCLPLITTLPLICACSWPWAGVVTRLHQFLPLLMLGYVGSTPMGWPRGVLSQASPSEPTVRTPHPTKPHTWTDVSAFPPGASEKVTRWHHRYHPFYNLGEDSTENSLTGTGYNGGKLPREVWMWTGPWNMVKKMTSYNVGQCISTFFSSSSLPKKESF